MAGGGQSLPSPKEEHRHPDNTFMGEGGKRGFPQIHTEE